MAVCSQPQLCNWQFPAWVSLEQGLTGAQPGWGKPNFGQSRGKPRTRLQKQPGKIKDGIYFGGRQEEAAFKDQWCGFKLKRKAFVE